MSKVTVFGGNGYVGVHLVQKLISIGHDVTVLDLVESDLKCHQIIGDVRDKDAVRGSLIGCDAVIHLACLSNDPTADLDPALARSINLDCFPMMLDECKKAGIKRFIYASSSSVYGVREEKDVIETTPLTPLTDYSKYKIACEELLLSADGFERVIIRPATICGYSNNLRLDLCVHILTMAALKTGKISVYGGSQYRPNIHIDDICDAYIKLLDASNIDGEIFNCGYQNLTIMETAQMIRNVIGGNIEIIITPTDDLRSYHVSSQKIADRLNFHPSRPIGNAIMEIQNAFNRGNIENSDDSKYYRVRSIKEMGLVA